MIPNSAPCLACPGKCENPAGLPENTGGPTPRLPECQPLKSLVSRVWLLALLLLIHSTSMAVEGVRIQFTPKPRPGGSPPPALSALLFEARHPVAKLLVVHGMQSNAEWFRTSGEFLSENGITVLAFDRRGSGRSGGPRGDACTAEDFFDDMEAACAWLQKTGPFSLPIHVHANCFGVRVALPFVQSHPDRFCSIIITSPSTDMASRADYSLGTKLFRILNPFVPSTRYLPTPLQDTYFITHPEKELDWVRDDTKSLSLRKVTKRFLLAANAMTKQMQAALPKANLPMLVILADCDAVVDNPKIEKRFARERPGRYEMKTLKSEHLMERSESQQEYRREMLRWLKTHSSKDYVSPAKP